MDNYITATSLMTAGTIYPIVKLMRACREEVEMAHAIKGDIEKGHLSLKVTPQCAFRFIDKLWRAFEYQGLSFDSIIIDPICSFSHNISELKNVVLHISVKQNAKDNRLKFYINRK